MILTSNSSRNSSRVAFWSVFGLGALLLVPAAARTEPGEHSEQPTRDEQIKKLQGEIELLKLQVQLKEAHLRAAKLLVDQFRKRLESHRSANRLVPGNIPEEVVAAARLATTEVEIKEAELQEPLVRLKLAERRLADLQRSAVGEREQRTRIGPQLKRRFARKSRIGERSQGGDERERTEQIEKLQDEIELLRVQVKIKEAQIQAEQTLFDEYCKRREIMLRQNQIAPGTVPQEELKATVLTIKTHLAQQRIKEAERQEPLVRLKQAERHLARLQRPPLGAREQQEQRLQELEKKVNQVLDEMKALQRELHPAKPGQPPSKPAAKP